MFQPAILRASMRKELFFKQHLIELEVLRTDFSPGGISYLGSVAVPTLAQTASYESMFLLCFILRFVCENL